jgi:predicted nucleotidyltransferase
MPSLDAVCREFDLVLVVLFGSRARGDARPDSDSDVGVLRSTGLVPAERFLDLAVRLGNATGLPDIDLVDLRRASGLLQHQAGTHGRPLFEDEGGRFNVFRVAAWKRHLDEAVDFRRLDADYIREGLERLRT